MGMIFPKSVTKINFKVYCSVKASWHYVCYTYRSRTKTATITWYFRKLFSTTRKPPLCNEEQDTDQKPLLTMHLFPIDRFLAVQAVAAFCLLQLLITLVWMRQVPAYLKSRINGLRQFPPAPIHQGTLKNSTWHWDSVVLLNNLPSDPIVPQWGGRPQLTQESLIGLTA